MEKGHEVDDAKATRNSNAYHDSIAYGNYEQAQHNDQYASRREKRRSLLCQEIHLSVDAYAEGLGKR